MSEMGCGRRKTLEEPENGVGRVATDRDGTDVERLGGKTTGESPEGRKADRAL